MIQTRLLQGGKSRLQKSSSCSGNVRGKYENLSYTAPSLKKDLKGE